MKFKIIPESMHEVNLFFMKMKIDSINLTKFKLPYILENFILRFDSLNHFIYFTYNLSSSNFISFIFIKIQFSLRLLGFFFNIMNRMLIFSKLLKLYGRL